MTQFITIISEIRIKKIDKTDEISFRSIGASARGSPSEPSCVAAGSLGVGRGRRGASGGRSAWPNRSQRERTERGWRTSLATGSRRTRLMNKGDKEEEEVEKEEM